MKVKIGTKVYDSEKEPIMVVLSDDDKNNITQMLPDATKYCSFPNDIDHDEIKKFMKL